MVSFFVKNINVVGMVSLCLFAEITGCEAGVFFWWQYLWLSRYLAGCGLLWHPGVNLGLMILCLGMWHQLEFFCKNRVVMALQAM